MKNFSQGDVGEPISEKAKDHSRGLPESAIIRSYALGEQTAEEQPQQQQQQLQQQSEEKIEGVDEMKKISSAIQSDVDKKLLKQHIGSKFQTLAAAGRQSTAESSSTTSSNTSSSSLASSKSEQHSQSCRGLRSLARLYGRNKQISQLKHTLETIINDANPNTHEMVLIYGSNGSGKTALLNYVRHFATSHGGHSILWKFKHPSEVDSGSEFLDALYELCIRIRDRGEVQEVKELILNQIGTTGYCVLLNMITFLGDIFGTIEGLSIQDYKSVVASGRHLDFIAGFFKALSSKQRPLVFLFDDIHLGESCAHKLLEHIIRDSAIEGVLFVATAAPASSTKETQEMNHNQNTTQWRTASSDLNNLLYDLDNTIGINTSSFTIGDLSQNDVNQMMSDLLHVPTEACKDFSDTVFRHTHGNVAFALECVKMLQETGVLQHSPENREWNCHTPPSEVLSKYTSCLDVVKQRLNLLSHKQQNAMKVASCLGKTWNSNILHVLLGHEFNMPDFLHSAESMDLLATCGFTAGNRDDFIEVCYAFSHTAIRDASYGLIALEERPEIHLRIGRRLWRDYSKRRGSSLENQSEEQSSSYDPDKSKSGSYSQCRPPNRSRKGEQENTPNELSLIYTQFSLGASAMRNQREKYGMAALCLDFVGDLVHWSMFRTAASVLELGISMLTNESWKEEYDLTLALYNAVAEINYTIGKFDAVNTAVDVVMKNARVFEDKVQAHCTRLYVLNSTEKADVILKAGLDVLRQLGVCSIGHPDVWTVRREYILACWFLHGRSMESLRRLPVMQDKRQLGSLRVLNILFLVAYLGEPYLAPLIAIQMMRITVRHGLCAISAYSFAVWGMLVSTYGVNPLQGVEFAKLAIEMLERFDAPEWQSRVSAAVYGDVLVWTGQTSKCIEHLERARIVGLDTGDIEFAMYSGSIKCTAMLHAGFPLSEIENETLRTTVEMKSLNQKTMLSITNPLLCLVRSLQKIDGFSFYMSTIESYLVDGLSVDGRIKEAWKGYHWNLLGYIFEQYAFTSKASELSIKYDLLPFRSFDVVWFMLLIGLSNCANMRKYGKNREMMRATRHCMKRLSLCSQYSPSISLGKKMLVQAEMRSLSRREQHLAFQDYVGAICIFKSQELIWEGAMANELCAQYLYSVGRADEAGSFINESIYLFRKWGCEEKVAVLSSKIDPKNWEDKP